jgi:hypothetical protein
MCKAEFTCAPPTRDELMQSFTGPEIAALIDAKCIIVATSDFSQNMVSGMKQNTKKAFQDGWSDWTESVLLIIEVCDIWEGEHLAFCDEHVQAVNLTQPIEWSKLPDYVCRKGGLTCVADARPRGCILRAVVSLHRRACLH